jgi:HK97 family phage prohead protease
MPEIINKFVRTFSTSPTAIDENERTIKHFITTPRYDRVNDIIDPQKLDITDYNKIVLFNHDRYLPVGKNVDLFYTSDGVIAKTRFTKTTQTGEDCWNLIKDDILNSWSISFQALEVPKLNEKDGYNFGKIGLLEYSIVSVPCNPDAINLALKTVKSFELKEIFEKQIEDINFRNQLKLLSDKIENIFNDTKKLIDKDTMDKNYQDILQKIIEAENNIKNQNDKIDKAMELIAKSDNLLKIYENKKQKDDYTKLLIKKIESKLGKNIFKDLQ